jgi:serine/threonine protein kinase
MLKASAKTLSEKQAASVIGSIVHGLAYLHQINLLHRDIKSANILMGPGADVAKLSDFGLADFASAQLSGSLSGSLPFMAPEVVKDRKYSDKSDVYSLGITLIELLENTPPFNKLQRPKKVSSDCNDFINQCLAQDPAKRPTAVQLGLHPFLAKAPVPSAELFKDIIEAAKKAKSKRPAGMVASPSSGSVGPTSGATTTSNSGTREVTSLSSVGSGSNSNERIVGNAAFEELKAENARLSERIDEQDAEIHQLKVMNAMMAERLAALEHHLGFMPQENAAPQEQFEDMLVTHPVETIEMVETLHPTDLVHSTDSLLHVGLLPSQ